MALCEPLKKEAGPDLGGALVSTKSQRSALDAQATLGVAITRVDERVDERVLASLAALGAAAIRLERMEDVPKRGGVVRATRTAGVGTAAP